MARTWTILRNGTALTDDELARFEPTVLTQDVRLGMSLTLRENRRHYLRTLDHGDDVEFQDPVGTARFVGRVDNSRHESNELITYECVGHRQLASHVQVVQSGPDETDPLPYPRRIYNAPTDDADAAYNSGIAAGGMTVGGILNDLFDAHVSELRDEGAAPPTGNPYVGAELAGMSHIPPKVVLDGLDFAQAVDLLTREQGPTWGVEVGTDGIWHFFDRLAQSTNTITLDVDPLSENTVRSDLRKRYTAVKIFGRRGQGEDIVPAIVGQGTDEAGSALTGVTPTWNPTDEANWTRRAAAGNIERALVSSATSTTVTVTGKTWETNAFAGGYAIFSRHSWIEKFSIVSNSADTITFVGPLPPISTGDPMAVEFGGDSDLLDVFRTWQITDSNLRHVVLESTGEVDCCPYVLVIHRNSNGDVTNLQTVAVRFEGAGVFRTAIPLYRSPSNGRNQGDSSVFPDWKLVFCYRDPTASSALVARFPSTGFSGSASAAPYDVERELRVVEEEFRSQEDVSLYQLVAQEAHKLTGRVLARGRVTLQGVDYSRMTVRQTLSLDHSTDTTGWESLAAALNATSISFGRSASTELDVGDDGSSIDVDFGALRERIEAVRRSAIGRTEGKKLSDYANCRDEAIGRGVHEEYDDLDEPVADTVPMSEPSYTFPRQGADSVARRCLCDQLTNPCNVTQAQANAQCQFICMPDGQHGLSLRHPAAGNFCGYSHFLRFENWDVQPPTGYRGMYYPILCKGKDFKSGSEPPVWDPTGIGGFCDDGTTNHGMRDLIVVEPFDKHLDNEVNTAELLLEFLAAYDGYMQRNEEAHCCLDNRIACVDGHVWGGTSCPTGTMNMGTVCCETTVLDAIVQTYKALIGLGKCCSAIRQGTQKPLNCEVRIPEWNFNGCGPC